MNQWWRIHLSMQHTQVQALGWKIPWRRKWQPTPVFLPEKSHGQRSLGGYHPRGCKEEDMTQQLSMRMIILRGPRGGRHSTPCKDHVGAASGNGSSLGDGESRKRVRTPGWGPPWSIRMECISKRQEGVSLVDLAVTRSQSEEGKEGGIGRNPITLVHLIT